MFQSDRKILSSKRRGGLDNGSPFELLMFDESLMFDGAVDESMFQSDVYVPEVALGMGVIGDAFTCLSSEKVCDEDRDNAFIWFFSPLSNDELSLGWWCNLLGLDGKFVQGVACGYLLKGNRFISSASKWTERERGIKH